MTVPRDIPDEAIEAAARAIKATMVSESSFASVIEEARAALAAALPFLSAERDALLARAETAERAFAVTLRRLGEQGERAVAAEARADRLAEAARKAEERANKAENAVRSMKATFTADVEEVRAMLERAALADTTPEAQARQADD